MNQPEIQFLPLRGAIPLSETSELDLVVRIVPPAPDPDAQKDRPALNLALALDRSSSMSGGALELAREAACNLVAQLQPRDRVSVVAFDNEVECLVPSARVDDIPAIQRALRSLEPRGSTALHAGWAEGALQVASHFDPQATNRVLLLTDGMANVGECHPAVLAEEAGKLAAKGISTSTMGVGGHYHEELLNAMSQRGDGNFFHIEGPAQFETFFELELEGLNLLEGRRVSLGIKPARGVKAWVCNRLERTSFGNFMLPNLLRGVPTELVIKARVLAPASEQETPILNIRLAWDTLEGERQVLRESLALPAVSRGRLNEFPTDPQVFQSATLMEIARLKRKAAENLRRGDGNRAQGYVQRARDLAGRMPDSPARDAELLDLEHIAFHFARGDRNSAQKAAYFQQDLRSRGRSDRFSGRESR